jgi:4-hydroxybenzoate polyprenyltransferase
VEISRVIDGKIPLCVDLDGTLTPVDTLHESLLSLAKSSPLALLCMPMRLCRGKGALKREVALRTKIDVTRLPFNSPLLDWLKGERAAGRRLILVTAADSSIANEVGVQLGLFDEIIASNGDLDLSAESKRRALVERFGERGFDYAGNSKVDKRMWGSARKAIVVGTSHQVDRARRLTDVERAFPTDGQTFLLWIKALRLHQWAKNALIFLPALLAHKILQSQVLIDSVLAFLAFSLCASSVYVINDLLDLAADRQHPRKCNRPFANGLLSAQSGVVASFALLSVAISVAFAVGYHFIAVLCGYYVLTWAYSLRLKRAALVDVMTLAALYTMRIIAGSAATEIPLSFWLLAFSIFIFLSLGIVKRYTEINDAMRAGNFTIYGRGYSAADLPLLLTFGVASGYCTVVVVAFYIHSIDSLVLYHHRNQLWLVCPVLLYWIRRIWLLTARGKMPDDPVVFALRDRTSLCVLGIIGLIVLISV